MPTKQVKEKVRKMKREGKSPQQQAGEFVRNEIEEIRKGIHGARSTKQAIAIGLSEARRAGVALPPPKGKRYSSETKEKAKRDLAKGQKNPNAKPSPKRSRAITNALKREGASAASHAALSRQAKSVAKRRTAAERSIIGKKAAAAKSPAQRSAAARKAAATRRKGK